METASEFGGGSILSAFFRSLFDRVADFALRYPCQKREYDNYQLILKKLNQKLTILHVMLEDAENKQRKSPAVKKWLEELQEVAYQADDLLDLINTEALRIKVESQYPTQANQARCSTQPSYFDDEFTKEITPKLEEIIQNLEEFEHNIGILRLEQVQLKTFRLASTSLVEEDDVFGRDADKENIIEALLSGASNGEKISVISIVGLGGVGKTTLAQFVHKDERVIRQFDVRGWVCISEEYDPVRITKELLVSLKIHFASDESFNSLQEKLKEALNQKKFFLVLDDIWNRDYDSWLALSAPLNGGKNGSKILATTRDEAVARMMGSQHIYHLNLLAGKDCWSLFKRHAFRYRDANGILEFESIGEEIVKNCGGLPLAVKTIAGLLRSKETIEEWNEILSSDEWNQPINEEGILPSLRLSYNYLPSQLKRCFAYCAVFHKDYQFTKDEVILLWMANNLLGDPKGKKGLEDIGNQFLHELKVRSLFQESSDGKFFMHNLVNDLAKFVSGKHFLRLEDYQQQNCTSTVVRHFSYLKSYMDSFLKFKPLNESKYLRTFLPLDFHGELRWNNMISRKFLLEFLPELKSLRVLSLAGYCDIFELPNSFANLKQLRFLDLSYTIIRKLPSWICTFHNLQTLLLTNCYALKEFPEDMEKLVSLSYLDISGVRLIEMPIGIGRLESLKFLSTFIISKHGGSRIEELGKLCNLQGEFTISGLANVAKVKNASMAKMKEKKSIKKMNLRWDGDCNDSQVALNVLKDLQPHPKIEILEINGYCGTRFPNWLEDPSFHHLVRLSISRCGNCFCLPAIGQLPSLKDLTMHGLSKVLKIDQEFYGDGRGARPFPCLRKLRFQMMEEWREWDIWGNGAFSCMENLEITDCPKLTGGIPKQLPLLRKLRISGCKGLLNSKGELTICNYETENYCLRELHIHNMPQMKKLSSSLDLKEVFPHLEKLYISKCEQMGSIPMCGLPTTLKCLHIEKVGMEMGTCETCHLPIQELQIYGHGTISIENISLSLFHALKHLKLDSVRSMEELPILTSLQSLSVTKCESLTSFTVQGGLPASYLTDMKLYNLPKLNSLPERMQAFLPSLQVLVLFDCAEIECFPVGGLPSSLESLNIRCCEKLWCRHRDWDLHRLPSLASLSVSNHYGGEETLSQDDLLLPSTLKKLNLRFNRNMKKISYGVLEHLTSLQSLCFWNCTPPEEGLPSSISHLRIDSCPELRSLPDGWLPSSLSDLRTGQCPLLRSLPAEGLPASITFLLIYGCPLLQQRLEWEKGEDWPKVAHIHSILIDGQLIP